VGRGPAANLPVGGQSHLARHVFPRFAIPDLEELIDDFAFLVVINPGFRSLVKLRQ
jgi:hypothetical protein